MADNLKYTNTTLGGVGTTPVIGTVLQGRLQVLRTTLSYTTLTADCTLPLYVPKGSIIIGALFNPITTFTGTSGDKFAVKLGSDVLIADSVTIIGGMTKDTVVGGIALKVKVKADTAVTIDFTGTLFTAGKGELEVLYIPADPESV